MRQTPWLLGCTAVALALGTVSCTTFGTHVKGGFACQAPQGTCAPMSNIDAQAIAGLNEGTAPALIPTDSMAEPARFISAGDEGIPVRSGERVMRVVFPAHTDGRGVFHDDAVAHVVSEPSSWTLRPAPAPDVGSLDAAIIAGSPAIHQPQALAAARSDRADVTSNAPLNLREAAAGLSAPADPIPDPMAERIAIDMPEAQRDLPSPAAIAAARAGHRIGDAQPSSAAGRRRNAVAHRSYRRQSLPRAVAPTVPGAATAELNRSVLRKLSALRSQASASATRASGSTTPPSGLSR